MMPPEYDARPEYRLDSGFLGVCEPCAKVAFASRKAARKYARGRYPGAGLRAYQCRHHDADYWHVGHHAPEVISGEVPKALFYGPGGIGVLRHRYGTRRDPKGGR